MVNWNEVLIYGKAISTEAAELWQLGICRTLVCYNGERHAARV